MNKPRVRTLEEVQNDVTFARPGDKMKCNSCDTEIYEFKERVFFNDPITASVFKGINGFADPISGTLFVCPKCDNKLHNSIIIKKDK